MIVSGRHAAALTLPLVLVLLAWPGCGSPDREVTFDEPGMGIAFRYPQQILVHRQKVETSAPGAEVWSLASGRPDAVAITRAPLPRALTPVQRRENQRATVAALKAEAPGRFDVRSVRYGGMAGFMVAINRARPPQISRIVYLYDGSAQYSIHCQYRAIPKLLEKACSRILQTLRRT